MVRKEFYSVYLNFGIFLMSKTLTEFRGSFCTSSESCMTLICKNVWDCLFEIWHVLSLYWTSIVLLANTQSSADCKVLRWLFLLIPRKSTLHWICFWRSLYFIKFIKYRLRNAMATCQVSRRNKLIVECQLFCSRHLQTLNRQIQLAVLVALFPHPC